MSKLKPCPFCGQPPAMLHGGPGNHFVRCLSCHATSDDGSVERISAAWNTRAYEPDQARIAELTAALRDLIEVASPNIYPKPDVGPEHPWSVLERARAALEKRHAD